MLQQRFPSGDWSLINEYLVTVTIQGFANALRHAPAGIDITLEFFEN